MRVAIISTPLTEKERLFLRLLNERAGEPLMARGLAEKLSGAPLVHAGYAERDQTKLFHFLINQAGETYLGHLARAH